MAWVGPCISQPSYEVDRATAEYFHGFANCVTEGENDRFHLDLTNIAQHQLLEVGVEKIYQSNMCTYKDDKNFFSHRRAHHQGLSACGRQVSVIGFT
jgi:copper oxidase (laccase) domain-containing protein